MDKIAFPIDLLRPEIGYVSFEEFGASISISLPPFELSDHGKVDTKLLLDCIELPSQSPADWAGKRFEFPINPAGGAIEGSVYMGHHHHPVDVTAIGFGALDNGHIIARFQTRILFSFEGLSASEDSEYADAEWAFEIPLSLDRNPHLKLRLH